MKKHLFLLGSFMATSLVTANSLLVISCKKKANKDNDKDDEKNTDTIINEKANVLIGKIRNIIDEIITNPNREDWLIDLKGQFESIASEIIANLDKAVDTLTSKEKDKQTMLLNDVPSLDQGFIDKITAKFASLKEMITNQILQSDEIDSSNLEFDLVSDSIVPVLTSLNGSQVIDAISKLKNQKDALNGSSNSMAKQLGYAANETKLELFKVKTNLKYNFKIADKTFVGEYADAELLLTGDPLTYKKQNQITYNTIKEIFNTSKDIKDVKIYGGNDEELKAIQQYDYIGKRLDWDFSKVAVKNEIQNMQYEQLEAMKENQILRENLKFKSKEDIEFEIDPANCMKFNNHDMDLKMSGEDNILIKQQTASSISNNEEVIKTETEAIASVKNQFITDGDEKAIAKDWNGGKINRDFIAQAKIDGENKEKHDFSQYYGLAVSEPTSETDLLIGYGTTSIRGAKYAGLPLAKLEIYTNITASFDLGIENLYGNLEKYVGGIVKALKGNVQVERYDGKDYYLSWRFPNADEWDAILTEVEKEENNKTVSFNWIMDKVLKDIRIVNDKTGNFGLPIGEEKIPANAWSFLRSDTEIKYQRRGKEDMLIVHEDYRYNSAPLYVKYGPFTVYLVGDDAMSNWGSMPNRGIIGKTF